MITNFILSEFLEKTNVVQKNFGTLLDEMSSKPPEKNYDTIKKIVMGIDGTWWLDLLHLDKHGPEKKKL